MEKRWYAMVSPIPSSHSEVLMNVLLNHFKQVAVEGESAILHLLVNDVLVPIKVTKKEGFQDTVNGLKVNELKELAESVIKGIHSAIEAGGPINGITIDLDHESIKINDQKTYSFKKVGVKSIQDEINEANEKLEKGTKTKTALTSSHAQLSEEIANLTEKQKVFENVLKELASINVDRSQEEKRKDVEQQKAKLEENIQELRDHLQRVQDQLEQASIAVDLQRDELANLKQASLLVSVFQKVQKDNFEDFFGFTPPDLSNRSKL